MSEAEQRTPDDAPPREERRLELPGWVPAAIGLTLVLLAAMAVYTGFRTRVRPHERAESVSPFTESDGLFPEEAGGPPGAPGPGGSRVRPEQDVPAPEPLGDVGDSAFAISGGATGVSGRKSLSVRRGLVFDVVPPDAVVYVNEVGVGSVRQFDSEDSAYEFAEEGVFSVKVVSPGYSEVELVVSAGHEASEDTAIVTLRLEPLR